MKGAQDTHKGQELRSEPEASPQDQSSLIMPVVSYKNNQFGNSNTVILHPCSNTHLCPVTTFHTWKEKTVRIHTLSQHSQLLFQLQEPFLPLSAKDSTRILKNITKEAGLNPGRLFTTKTFQKTRIMSGINASVQPNTIFQVSSWSSAKTFWHHYITHTVPPSYTNLLFNIEESKQPIKQDLKEDVIKDDIPSLY